MAERMETTQDQVNRRKTRNPECGYTEHLSGQNAVLQLQVLPFPHGRTHVWKPRRWLGSVHTMTTSLESLTIKQVEQWNIVSKRLDDLQARIEAVEHRTLAAPVASSAPPPTMSKCK